MSYFRCGIATFVLSSSLSSSANLAEPSTPHNQLAQPTDTKEFADVAYGYSIRFPSAWKPYPRASKAEPPQRLCLFTPNKSTFIISVSQLPRSVTSHSEFEQIGHDYVDSVVNTYLKSFDITFLREQKGDHSDQQSMKFWQGTSGTHASLALAMLISLHAIRYGSHFMINILYVSGHNSKEEVIAVDAVMNSLSFTTR
jgi:hypothetical protein